MEDDKDDMTLAEYKLAEKQFLRKDAEERRFHMEQYIYFTTFPEKRICSICYKKYNPRAVEDRIGITFCPDHAPFVRRKWNAMIDDVCGKLREHERIKLEAKIEKQQIREKARRKEREEILNIVNPL